MAPRKKLILERDVENAFLRRLKKERPNAQAWKCNGRGHAARPDRMIVFAAGRVCWIEFKRPGNYPTPAQQRELDGLEALNHAVAACDSVVSACTFIDDVEFGKLTSWRERWNIDHGI